MKNKPTQKTSELRKQAEKTAAEKAINSLDDIKALSITEIQQLLHELQVHQIELEMQNDELRRTQLELDATRARYFNLYDLAPIGYVTLSEIGIILESNITAATLLEVAKGAMVKQPLSKYIFKEDQDIYYLFRKQLFEIGGTQSCELRMVKKDGTDFWMNLTATATQDVDGATVCRVVITDITDRKRAEKTLQESEKQYRYLFDLANEGLIMTTLAGQLYQVNQAFAEMHGYTVDELKHMDINDLDVLGERLLEERADFIRRIQAGETVRFEVEHYHKDGHIFPLTVTTSMIDIEGKQYYLSFNQDITERKQAEEILREKEQQFRDIFDNSAEAILIFDIDGVIVSANPMANTMYGYEGKEMIGLSDKDIISPNYYHVSEDFKQQLARSGLYRGESVDVRSDGTTFNIEVRGSSFIQKGKPYVLAMVRDVTDRKQMEARLQQAQRLEGIGTLAGGIAHDFNNLLFPLLGFAELLKEDIPADSPLQEHIDEILSATLRSKDLVKQILAVSRRDEPSVIPIRLQPIVKEAMDLLRASIPTTIDIQNDIDPQCGMVMADPTKIHQIVMNLVTNAYHAMEDKGGRLDVTLKKVAMTSEADSLQTLAPGNYVLLTVSDNGTGIEKEILDRIFDPYFTTKGVGKGTGLGLSVVHGIVTSHKGVVDVSSVPGKGSKFSVYLPIMEHVTEHIIAENAGPDPVGTEKILLVDDEKQIIRVEQQMLERLGYRVTSRAGSKEALEVFKANPGGFDLVLTDMTMPNMTGIELARELISIRRDIPVIICTGFSTMLNDERTKSNGIKGVLRKPVVKSNMAHMVRKVLDEAKGSAKG